MSPENEKSRLPIKLRPEPVERVWGGDSVKKVFGWSPPEGKTVGEWWTLSFRQDHPSIIAEGEHEGMSLPRLINDHPELLGDGRPPALLIKIIDSAQRLSVQVHPDERLAEKLGLDSGKTECWYFLESDPDAKIFCGLEEGADPDAFFARAEENAPPDEMERFMKQVPVRSGGLAFISAGTVHAIGEGVMLLEVQQNSDSTFRIYDWGRPREVHLKKARQAMEEAATEQAEIDEQGTTLVSCSRFIMDRIAIDSRGTLPPTGGTYASITCLEGAGEISAPNHKSAFQKGDSFFLPAGCPELLMDCPGKGMWIRSYQVNRS